MFFIEANYLTAGNAISLKALFSAIFFSTSSDLRGACQDNSS